MKNKEQNQGRNRGKERGFLWIAAGLLLITAALFLTAYNLYDGIRAGQTARHAAELLEEEASAEVKVKEPLALEEGTFFPEEMEIPDYILNPEMEMPVKTIDGIDYIGVLRIFPLDLELPVISQWSYPRLRKAPARYKGSAYTEDLIIAGHNYSAHFGALKSLSPGDHISFTDMEGNVFDYVVAEQEILYPEDVEQMEAEEWDLTLFTCTVGGRSRVTVRCVRQEE